MDEFAQLGERELGLLVRMRDEIGDRPGGQVEPGEDRFPRGVSERRGCWLFGYRIR
ncbi:hypothetical protein [Streptomyces sp. RB17]|uniref:hypothetical protein n=1 Tax=Streptomyces sp. RB17 TaxID=2585197 RepID=UPI001297B69E